MNLQTLPGISEEIKISLISEPNMKIRSNKENIADLASSIMREGLLNPIIVRPNLGRFELVAGSRRLAACSLLGWRKIPCQAVELTDQEAFEIALAENVARQTLHPLDEALAFQDYVKKYGWGSQTSLARKIGKSPAYISKRLKLLSLPEKTLRQLFQKKINPSLAEEISAIEDQELRSHIVTLSSELDLTSKEIRRIRKQIKTQKVTNEEWSFRKESLEDQQYRTAKHAIQRTVVALRVALRRLDDVIANIADDQWVLKEILMQQRLSLHSQIDLVANLTRRLRKLPRPLYEDK